MAETNHNRTSTDSDGRATMRTSMHLSLNEEDVYALGTIGVCDGFRPSTISPTGQNRISLQRERRSTPPPRPSSTTKPRALDTFALRHDGVMGIHSRPDALASSSSAGSITRSSSVSTNIPVLRPDSPYQGPARPSHPYHMYPQTTRAARTASIMTTSTIQSPSERHYTGPLGPTHPYGMYPQSTVSEAEGMHNRLVAANIPVGFPGHGNDYQRRIGPDGEEAADIIGPFGHTEQLPPYTQYPDQAFTRKPPPMDRNLSGAGGIGLATRDPEFTSREDLNSPLSMQSNRSTRSDASDHQINLAASEKPPEKKWKVVAKRKVCGIVPVWVFVLVGVVLFAFAFIVGTAVGILSHKKFPSPKSSEESSSASTYSYTTTNTVTASANDASPLSSAPTGLPSLPTGTFALSLPTPLISLATCLDSSSFYSSWSCALPPTAIQINVAPDHASNNLTSCYNMEMSQRNIAQTYFYGSQQPVADGPQILTLVKDKAPEGDRYGLAWNFQTYYRKLVIVPENQLSAPPSRKRGSNERRSNDGPGDSFLKQKAVAQSGDKPWFCYWNDTILETFIYINSTSRSGAQAASASAASASIAQTALASSSQTQSATTTATAASASTTGSKPMIMLDGYPKVAKVEEIRPSGAKPPYCVQMDIQSDGSATPRLGSDGKNIIINLNEVEPECRCVWLVT